MTRHYACEAFATIDDVYDAACGCEAVDGEDDALVATMIDQASDILALLSGLTVAGQCLTTVRPIYKGGCGPTAIANDWTTRFGGIDTIPLRGPNVDIVEILIDGNVIAASDYKLLDGLYLMRISANWPTINDLRRDETQTNTFAITYRFGWPHDKLTNMACVELACELIKDAKGQKSTLRGVTSINIQGATAQVRDRAGALRDGEEQIPVVARWMSLHAPDGPMQVSTVWSPELDQDWELVAVTGPSGS